MMDMDDLEGLVRLANDRHQILRKMMSKTMSKSQAESWAPELPTLFSPTSPPTPFTPATPFVAARAVADATTTAHAVSPTSPITSFPSTVLDMDIDVPATGTVWITSPAMEAGGSDTVFYATPAKSFVATITNPESWVF